MKNRWFRVLHHNSHSPKVPKNPIIFDIFCYSNRYFSITTGLPWTIKISNEKPYSCRGWCERKTKDISLFIKILLVQNFQKVNNKNDSSLLTKLSFSVTTILISLTKVTISNVQLSKRFDPNSSHLVFCIEIDFLILLTYVDYQSHCSL